MRDTIERLLSVKPEYEQIKGKTGLPLYLTSGVSFYKTRIWETVFYVVELSNMDNTTLPKLKHGLEQYEKVFAGSVAYCLPSLPGKKRDALIKARIPFIAPPGQLYLPFLGMVLQDRFPKEKKVAKEKMSPLEQLLFLYLLNHCDAYTKAQLAEKLHVTRAAVTKVTEELGRKGLISEKKTGKEVYVSVNRDPKTCYSGAHKWMGTPVKNLVYCADRKACEHFLLAGESALSDMSMLAAPRNEVRACYEKDPRLAKLSLMDDAGWEGDRDYTCLQVWKYNPELISAGKAVDILSLSLSLANVFDERVQGELQDVLEEEGWL